MNRILNTFLILIFNTLFLSTISAQTNITYQTLLDGASFDAKTTNTTLQVGIVNLNANVSSNGGSNYSLPIQLPTGINGLNAAVSIQYNSNSGNGILGYGCHLNAASAITYDNADLYHETQVALADINTGSNERFVLDGQRLIKVGAEFRTEAESFASITTLGGTSAIPQSFKVISKDGVTSEYGTGIGARVTLPSSSNPIMWKLSSTADNLGNRIEYEYSSTYFDSNTGVENVLTTIRYKNSAGTEYATVNFVYKTRTADKNQLYVYNSGTATKLYNTLLLTSINVVSEGLAVRTYEFEYANNGLYSVLQEIKLKGANGAYLNSTWLNYGLTTGSKTYSFNVLEAPDFVENYYGDFDGDGQQDLFLPYYKMRNNKKMYYRFEVYKFNVSTTGIGGLGTENATSVLMDNIKLDTIQVVGGISEKIFAYFELKDVDGDKRDDILFIRKINNGSIYGIQRFKWNETLVPPTFDNPAGGNYSTTVIAGVNPKNQLQLDDFDADNRTDYIYQSGTDVTRITLPALGIADQAITNLSVADFNTHFKNADSIYTADFNGDGKQDLLLINGTTTYVYSIEKPATQYGAKLLFSTTAITKSDTLAIGDFNGDGMADIWKLPKLNLAFTNFKIYYSSGTNLYNRDFVTSDYNSSTLIHKNKLVADINGDGKCDISFTTNNSNSTARYFSNGESFVKTVNGTYPAYIDMLGKGYKQGVVFNNATLGIDVVDTKKYVNYNFNLVKIKDGHGNVTEFNYKYLTYDPDYTHTNIYAAYPLNEITPALRVVDKISIPDGIGGILESRYFYKQMAYHNKGLGGLGFIKTSSLNQIPGVSNLPPVPPPTLLSQSFAENTLFYNATSGFYTLLPYKTWSCKTCTGYNDATFKSTVTAQAVELDGASSRRFFIKNNSTETLDDLHGYKIVSTNVYDNGTTIANGNITTSYKEAYTNGTLTETTNTTFSGTPLAITPLAIPSLFPTITTSNIRNGETFTKTINNTYTTKGDVLTATDGYTTTTTYAYDYTSSSPLQVGNVTQVTTADVNGTSPTRMVKYTYSNNGRFLFETKNDVNDVLLKNENYDVRWEAPTKVTDFYGKYTDYTYDANFGWLTSEKANRISTASTYAKSFSIGTPTGAIYKTLVTIQDAPATTTYYDILNRAIKTEEVGIVTKVSTAAYNAKGQLTSTTMKGAQGADITTTYSSYDDYSRVGNIAVSSGVTTQYVYTNATGTVRVTSNTGEYKETKTDATGKLTSSQDNNGILTYTYFGNGALKNVSLGGTLIQECAIYPNTGFQKYLTDKNAGTTSYIYNGFGDIISQADNCDANGTPNATNSSIYNITYDNYGRIMTSNLQNQNKSYDVTTNYVYSTATNTPFEYKYLLKSITDNVNSNKQEFTYDGFQRPASVTTTLLTDNKKQIKTINYLSSKDLVDMVSYTKLEANPTANLFTVKYGYNAYGNITSIKGSDDGGTTLKNIFTSPTYNYFNQVTAYTLGDVTGAKTVSSPYDNFGFITKKETASVQKYDYSWNNAIGNLNSRTYTFGATTPMTESFGYDANTKQNLTQITFGSTINNIDYAPNGNITNKYDAGVMASGNAYTYDGTKIHAVTEIKTTDVFPSAIKTTPQTISYTPFKKPTDITEGIYNQTFIYGLDEQRIKSVYRENGTPKNTRYYFGDYEQYIDATTAKTYDILYVSTPAGLGSVVMKEGANSLKYYNVYTDHLGSITALTDEAGAIAGRQSFDAWGRKRNPDNWTYTPFTQPANSPFGTTGSNGWLNRGYTTHEHMDYFDLINMNGRMYDPVVGRMLSPDNFVSDATSTQAFNRYSYANNNPLKYIDPSGWSPDPPLTIINNGPMGVAGMIDDDGNGLQNPGFQGPLWSIIVQAYYGFEYHKPAAYNSNHQFFAWEPSNRGPDRFTSNYDPDWNREYTHPGGRDGGVYSNGHYYYTYYKPNGGTYTFRDTEDPANIMDNATAGGDLLLGVAKGTLAWISADVVVPDPSDAAIPKWIGYGIAGTLAYTYIHGNSRFNPNQHIVYEIYGIRNGVEETVKYGISDYEKNGDTRPKSQIVPLSLDPEVIAGGFSNLNHRIISYSTGRIAALELEYLLVQKYKIIHGRNPIKNKRPMVIDIFEP